MAALLDRRAHPRVDEALELVRPERQVAEPQRAARGHEVQVRPDRDRERRASRQRVIEEREIGYRRRAEVDDLGERVGFAALVDDVEMATGLEVRLRRLEAPVVVTAVLGIELREELVERDAALLHADTVTEDRVERRGVAAVLDPDVAAVAGGGD